MTLKVVGGVEVDRGYAFRPSSLEAAGIRVEFRRSEVQRRFNWRRLRWCPAFWVYEVWIEEDGPEFEPGNSWIEWSK